MSSDRRVAVITSLVRDLRQQRGLSQRAAAEIAGLSQQEWQRLEKGRDVQLSTLDAVLMALGVDLVAYLSQRVRRRKVSGDA